MSFQEKFLGAGDDPVDEQTDSMMASEEPETMYGFTAEGLDQEVEKYASEGALPEI